MEGLNVVVAFDEVIDNSIRANARHITYASIDRGGRVTGLVAKDDGVRAALLGCAFSRCPAHWVASSCSLRAHQACRGES